MEQDTIEVDWSLYLGKRIEINNIEYVVTSVVELINNRRLFTLSGTKGIIEIKMNPKKIMP